MDSIDVLKYKPSHEAPHRLADREEARGELLRIFESDGRCIAVFSWGAISLPLDLRERLVGMVGHEIACLRLDGKIYIRGLDSD